MGWFSDFFGGGGSSSNDTSNDNDDDPGFFDDGGAFESFFDSVGLDVDGDAADGVSGGVANLGDTDGDGRGEFAFTDNASDEDRSNVASGDVGLAGTITNVSGNITDTPIDTGSSDRDSDPEPTFSEAYAAARAAQGPGGVFTWNGQQYSTNTAEEEAAAAEPEEAFDEDYTPTAEELAAQLEEAGLESAISDPLSVEEQVAQYDDVEFPDEGPGRDLGADLGIGMSEDTVTAEEIAGDEVQAPGTVTLQTSGGGSVTISTDDPRIDQIIDGTLTADDLVGVGVVPETVDQGLKVGDPITPQLAAELGVSYFEGDTLDSADIEDLRDLGFDVDESTITGTLEGTIGLGDVAFTGGQPDVASVIEANASDAPTISASRLSDLESYVADLLDIQGSYSVEDLDGAGFTADEIAAYEQLVAPGKLSAEDLAAIQEQYGDLTMAQYNALEETFGSYLGTMLKGSAGMLTEMTGNLLSAAGEIDKKTLEALGYEFQQDDSIATQVGERLVSSGRETQEQFLEQLQTRYPEEYEDFLTPIFDPETGEFNGDALKTKALYSSLPTLAGFAGLPFGPAAFVVTGGLMTAGEIGTEARKEAEEVYKEAIGAGFSEEEAQMIGRSANLIGAALGVPIGAISNKLFIDTLAPGVGAPMIAKIASAAVQSALDEGYVEQVAIGTAVNSLFEGQEGPLADITQGTDEPSEAVDQFFGNIAFDRFSMDEMILGGLTGLVAGGAITMSGYAKAKAAGMSDQEILNQAEATPEGETVTLTDSSGNVVAEGTVPVSDIMFSGNPVEMRTDADGNSVIVDTVTGDSAVMPAGTTLEAGETTGTETTVNDLTASEILQGDNITIGQDSEGNITLTDNDTGLTTNVEGNLFYDAFGNSYNSAEAAAAADAGYGLTGQETTVEDLQQVEDEVIGAEGADVTVESTGDDITLTNQETGMQVILPSWTDVSLIDIVNAVQNNDTTTASDAGAVVSDAGSSFPTIEDITESVLAGLPDAASPEQVTNAINEAVSGIDTVTPEQVRQIVTDTLGSIDTLTEQEVSEIVQNVVNSQEVLAQSDVEAIVADAMSTVPTVEDITASVLASLPESATPQQVTDAINTAISDLENLSSTDVQQIVADALGNFETLSEQDVTGIVEGVVAAQDVLTEQDVSGIVDAALQAGLGGLEETLNTRIGELEAAGVDRAAAVDQALSELSTNLGTTEQALLDPLGTTASELQAGFEAGLGGLEETLNTRIGELEAAGVDRAAAVDQALSELSTNLGTTEQALLDQLGTTASELQAGFEAGLGGLEETLNTRIGELETAGVDRAAAVDQALSELSTNLGTTEQALLDQLGTTASELQAGFEAGLGGLEETLNTRIGELETAGVDRAAAVDQALSELSTNLGTTEQALLDQLGTTASELQAGFEAGLGGLEETLNTRIGELETAGVDRAAAVDQALSELSTNLGTTEQALLDQLGTTASELQAGFETQLETGLAGLENTLNTRIGELEAAGVDRAAAVDQVFAQIDTAMQKLDNSIRPGGSLEQQFGEDLNAVESSLIERIQELEASGTERSDAISQIVSELGQSMDSFEESSKAEFESLENRLSAKIERLEAAGLDRETALNQALSALSAQYQISETAILDRLSSTTAQLLGYQTDVQKLETNINTRIGELEAAGVDRASAVDQALSELSTNLGTTEQALLDQLGTTESELQAGFEAGLGGLEETLNTRIGELEAAGVDRAAAVDQALSELSTNLGTTEQALLDQLGTTSSELQAGFEAGLGSLEETLNTRIGELEAAGVDRAAAVDQALNEVALQVGETKESLLQTLGETEQSILASVSQQVSDVESTLVQRIAELEAAGVDRATAVDQALSELSTNLGTTEQELLAQVGETEQSLLSEIGSVEQSLIERTQELEESGIARDEALRVALGEVATNLGTTEESLLSEIGQTEESLLGEIGEVQAGLTQQIGAVEQTLIERTQELEQSGLARDEALQVALGEVATNLGTTEQALLNEIGQTEQSLTQQIENVQSELATELGVTNQQLAEILAVMEQERQDEQEYLASLEGEPELDRTPEYIPSVMPQVGNVITEEGVRPVVAPYYQPQQAGVFSVYRPQPGVQQTPQGPVFETPQSYLAPTAAPQYGYGYIAPNADIEYLRNLARVQGTGAERLASERLMSDE